MIQLAWIVTDENGNILKKQSHIIRPEGFNIINEVAQLTRITTDRALQEGIALRAALSEFMDDLSEANLIVGHNIAFDLNIVGCELYREGMTYNTLLAKRNVCTMQRSTDFCAIPSNSPYGGYKWPKLEELHRKLFGCTFDGAHDALADIEATKKCYFALKQRGIV
jgi:DNA polymerase III epsilon subunit-like protein